MTFPIESVRAQFPSLSLTDSIQGKKQRRIYLDNPAGTQVTSRVIEAVSDCFLNANANLGGYFPTSIAAEKVVDDCHLAMANFMGTDDPGEIIIGATMTTLTMHMSRSICRNFKPGDEIIVTRMDHEGNVAAWLEIAQDLDLVIKWADFDKASWKIEPEHIKSLITDKTKLLALNYASNLTGAINDVKSIIAEAHKSDVLVYVDAVQLAPHHQIDVKDLGCDFLICSPYKFFGPHIGVLWGKRSILEKMHAYKCRCVPETLATKYETGTPAIELLAGLTAAIDYYAWLGGELGQTGSRRAQMTTAFNAAIEYEENLTSQLIKGLQKIDGVEIFGPTAQNQMKARVPTVSIRHNKVKPDTLAKALSDKNIFVWSGHNYAIGVVESLGIPMDEGILRIGIAHYNTAEEVATTLGALEGIVTIE